MPLGSLLKNIRKFSKHPYNYTNIEKWPYWKYQEEVIMHNEEVEAKNSQANNFGETISNIGMNRKQMGF